jgi:endonuclease/exonuclease/phosphatase family metal-dependent hydrolase
LATLGILGGLVWMFLQGGGLNQLAGEPGAGQTQAGSWNGGGFGLFAPSAPAPAANAVQPTAIGAAAPPMGAGPTIRIASFNIEVFGKTKADKPYVMHTLAEIVRQFHVVAIQEIRTQDDYLMRSFVDLINSGGRRFDFVVGPRLGNSTSKEQYAFIFDTERIEISQSTVYTVGDPDNLLHREPLVASFRTRGVNPDEAFTFTLVNVHTDPHHVSDELDALAEAYRVIRRAGREEDDVIMLGDFNADDSHLGRLGQIPGVTPVVRGVFTNTRQNRLYDNLIIHQPSTTEYAGRSGVFDVMRQFNLTLAQAEQVSDHFPVWAEFSVYERDYAGRIASRRSVAR